MSLSPLSLIMGKKFVARRGDPFLSIFFPLFLSSSLPLFCVQSSSLSSPQACTHAWREEIFSSSTSLSHSLLPSLPSVGACVRKGESMEETSPPLFPLFPCSSLLFPPSLATSLSLSLLSTHTCMHKGTMRRFHNLPLIPSLFPFPSPHHLSLFLSCTMERNFVT